MTFWGLSEYLWTGSGLTVNSERFIHGCGLANGNGERLIDFCAINNCVFGGTIFLHKTIHKLT